MKKILSLFTGTLFCGLLVFTNSCKKCIDMPAPESTGDSVNVYVAGYDYNATTHAINAVYWKNGSEVILSNPSHNAYATSIVVSGKDIYVAGYEVDDSNYTARYWKNGVAVSLTSGAHNAWATSIAVSGANVYVSGYESNGTKYVAKYWKNGSVTVLSNGSNDAYATSVAVSGSDVYVAGYENNGGANPYYQSQGLNSGRNDVAKYWKNGNAVILTDGTEFARAFSVTTNGADAYVAGQENVGVDPNSTNIAKYWKTTSQVPLTQGESGNANATSIVVYSSDVYVAGYQSNGAYYYAEYWKNGNKTLLTPQASTHNGIANSIAVYATDIYVAGNEASADGQSSTAKYWKNGNPVLLTSPNGPYQDAACIVVVKQ